jgi:1-acyl-sn-glycerol-3-phosphate acyltransferase
MYRMRAQVNRVVVVAGLLVSMPAVVIADKLRSGMGRAVALRAFRGAARVCGVRFDGTGVEQLVEGQAHVFVANHSSPLDIPALFVYVPGATWAAAAGLLRVPLLGATVRALGAVPIDRGNRDAARVQLAQLAGRRDAAVVFFPEGDIAPTGERLPFKMGAFALAIETGASVVPVALHGTDTLLPPRGRLLVRPGAVCVEFLAPIPTAGLSTDDREALRDRARRAIETALSRAAPRRRPGR